MEKPMIKSIPAGAKPRPKRWRWFIWGALLGLTLAGLTLAAIYHVAARAQPQPADVIIILGARVYPDRLSSSLRARLDVGLQLYQQNLAAQVIVSGGQGEDEPCTEAAAMRDYLVAHGMEQQVIHLEEQATSTYDNLRNSLVIMGDQGYQTALVVTSDYHLLRTGLIARRLGMSMTAAAAPLPVPESLRWRMLAREVLAIWKDMLLLPWYGWR